MIADAICTKLPCDASSITDLQTGYMKIIVTSPKLYKPAYEIWVHVFIALSCTECSVSLSFFYTQSMDVDENLCQNLDSRPAGYVSIGVHWKLFAHSEKYQNHMSLPILHSIDSTVKPVKNGHSKIKERNVLIADGSLMQFESIAEWSILQYF